MKRKTLFLILTLLWILNVCIGGYFLYGDFARGAGWFQDPQSLAHTLYMGAAMVAALMTFLQFLKYRNEE